MKRCSKCNRKYDDDTLRFCLEDGTPLFDARDSEAPPTEILPARGVPTLKTSGPTTPTFPSGGNVSARDREAQPTNPLLTGGVIAIAVLLLVLVAIVGFFVLGKSGGNESAKTDNQGSSPTVREGAASPASINQKSDKPDSRDGQPSPDSQAGTPLKITASASSLRLAVQANTYYAANAIDGKRTTAWIEGIDGPGLGEWIRFDFDREINLHRILIQPGYFKSPQIWAENNRLESVTAHFSDGSSRDLTFANRMDSQKVDVGSIRTHWVRFVIKSVYYGSDPDTAISEVAFEWDQ